jgi:hypothetical protein
MDVLPIESISKITHLDYDPRLKSFDEISDRVNNFLSNVPKNTDAFFKCMVQDSFEYIAIKISFKDPISTQEMVDCSTTCLVSAFEDTLTEKYTVTSEKLIKVFQRFLPEKTTAYFGGINVVHHQYTYKQSMNPLLTVTSFLPMYIDHSLYQTIHNLICLTFHRLSS